MWAGRTPDNPALVHKDETVDYGQLHARVGSVASFLVDQRVRQGDRVALIGHNSISWVVAYLACLRVGAVVSPTNNRLSPTQFREQCDVLDARLVLHDVEHHHLGVDSGRLAVNFERLERRPRDRSVEGVRPLPQPGDDALISFTSGTTGTPKGAVITHDSLFQGSKVFADYLATSSSDSTLVVAPLFHNTGFVDQLGHMLIVGGATHLLTRFRTTDAVEELRLRPVTFLTAVPSVLRLLTVADGADAVYGPARIALFGGSPMPAAWSEELLDRWPHLRLVHGYGLTEFTSACAFLPHELISERGESVGRPAPGVLLKVVDSDGSAVETGATGEIWVAGRTRMRAYWNQPELTAEKLAGEWLRTGDLGYVDPDGLLWLTGRVDDAINRGGEKILPAHVESRIAQLPEVAEATVFGYPDPVLLQRVAAAVQLRPGHHFDEHAARNRLLEVLPDYAVPDQWVVYDELPRTASGKADRREISKNFHTTARAR